jgi:hypothetical protein
MPMPDDNTSNLPILDDIIKPGNTDKAVHQPSGKIQNSLWSDDASDDSATTHIHAESDSHSADDDPADTIELFSDETGIDDIRPDEISRAKTVADEPPIEETLHEANHEAAAESQKARIDRADFDAITEEILDNTLLGLEQVLRENIRQTLKRHFTTATESD